MLGFVDHEVQGNRGSAGEADSGDRCWLLCCSKEGNEGVEEVYGLFSRRNTATVALWDWA